MVTKSKLKLALAAEKGVDFQKQKQQKKHKAALKAKKAAGKDDVALTSQAAEDEEQKYESDQINIDAVDESDTSDSSVDFEEPLPRRHHKLTSKNLKEEEGDDDDDDDEEDEEGIPISDLEDLDDEDKEDFIPHTRLTINNTAALTAALDRISIPTDPTTSFATHQSVTASTDTASAIPDVSDDLQRELAFYTQCLEAARQGRARLLAEGVPFSRPKDYFAEMVKEDAHMDKVKAKLMDEASSKKAAVEARKLRDLKKFGKKVQVAKLQERQKEKRETLEKIKTLKRKRQDGGGDMSTNEADIFDVGVENEIGKHKSRSAHKRQSKDAKYGFGGKKRHIKSGDAVSSGDLSNFNAKRMKTGPGGKGKIARPGKNRRKVMASK